MFIWLRRVSRNLSLLLTGKHRSHLHAGKQRRCHHVSFPDFFTAIFSCILLKEKLPSAAFFIGFCLAIVGIYLLSFSGGTMAVNPKGDLLAISAAAVWALYSILMKEIGKFGFPTIFVTRKNFRIRNPLYAPSTIIRVMSELAKDF